MPSFSPPGPSFNPRRGDWQIDEPVSVKSRLAGQCAGDCLAGIVVAIAFSIIAGVDPKVGFYASFCIAVIIAFTGGRPGMISAATGAMALLDDGFGERSRLAISARRHRAVQHFPDSNQSCKAGRLMRFVSRFVMTGFVNDLSAISKQALIQACCLFLIF